MEKMILKHNMEFKYSPIVREILGEYYEDFKAFFKKWIQDCGHEYKVFMSRRCFVLYQIFQLILMENGEEIDNSSQIIITDKGIVRHEDGLRKAKSLLLVDDVLIFGRTLNSMYDKLKKLSPQAQIEIAVYIKNGGDLCIKQELISKVWFRFEEETNIWREFSDRLVYCIYATNMPYTAFVNSYYKKAEQEEAEAVENRFSALKCYDVSNEFQQKYGLSAKVCFPEKEEKYPLFQTICRKCCVRVYYSNRCNKLLVIPYVFLKDIPMESLDKLCDWLVELLPDFQDDFQIKSSISVGDEAAYKARLLTCVFSYIYGALFAHELGISTSEWMDDRDTVQKSFHDNVVEKLLGLSVETMKKIVSEKAAPEMLCEDAIQAWYKWCEKDINNLRMEASLKESLYAYFRMEGDADEKRAKEKKEKLPGSTVGAILEIFKGQGDEEELYACLINTWDSGCASFDWAVSEDGQYLTGINTEGEQNFRQIIEKYPLYFRDIALLLDQMQGEVLVRGTGELYGEIHNIIGEYCKEFSAPEEFENYILENESDLEKFAVSDIYNSLLDDIPEGHIDRWVVFCCKQF